MYISYVGGVLCDCIFQTADWVSGELESTIDEYSLLGKLMYFHKLRNQVKIRLDILPFYKKEYYQSLKTFFYFIFSKNDFHHS